MNSSVAAANQEEAATIAAEFLSSLDNLPNEVTHLLEEIRHKETRAQELQQDVIQKETTRYIRHALKNSATPKEGKENGKDKDKEAKDALIPGKVAAAFSELEQLANDRIALSSRLVELLTRVGARLDHDFARVIQLSGEAQQEQYEVRNGYIVGTLPGASAPIALSANSALQPNSARSVKEVQDSLRASISQELTAVNTPSSPSAAQGPQKRRRLNTGASVASINVSVSRSQTPQARSRLHNQVHPSPPPVTAGSRGGGGGGGGGGRGQRAPSSSLMDEDAEGEDEDADADGDDDQEETGDAEDQTPYCYCQKKSYGEMIACDNDDCSISWFHLGCVGLLKGALPDHWYCDECLKSLGGVGGRARQGRRKAQ